MTHRLFPQTQTYPWGIKAFNHRCPRCHVHRFGASVPKEAIDRMADGRSNCFVIAGRCERCGFRQTLLMHADGQVFVAAAD